MIETKFQAFLDRQNSVCKCACNEVMRSKDFSHHRFFCSVGETSPISDSDVNRLVEKETNQEPSRVA